MFPGRTASFLGRIVPFDMFSLNFCDFTVSFLWQQNLRCESSVFTVTAQVAAITLHNIIDTNKPESMPLSFCGVESATDFFSVFSLR